MLTTDNDNPLRQWNAYFDPEGPIGRGTSRLDAIYDLINGMTDKADPEAEFRQIAAVLAQQATALTEEKRAHEAAVMVTVSKWRGEVDELRTYAGYVVEALESILGAVTAAMQLRGYDAPMMYKLQAIESIAASALARKGNQKDNAPEHCNYCNSDGSACPNMSDCSRGQRWRERLQMGLTPAEIAKVNAAIEAKFGSGDNERPVTDLERSGSFKAGWCSAIEAALAEIPGGDVCSPQVIADALRALRAQAGEARIATGNTQDCPYCDGMGHEWQKKCVTCDGSGKVPAQGLAPTPTTPDQPGS